jgi:hypothetical protein
MRPCTIPLARGLAAAGVAALLAACAPDSASGPDASQVPSLARAEAAAGNGQSGLAAVRAATARYHRVEVAIADGYVNTGECVASPAGGMGIHFVNPALMGAPMPGGDATFDPTRPEVLVYEPKDGKLKLVAVEYLIWRAAWDAANPGGGPTYLGQSFDESFGPESHGLPDHYELHAWIWQENPSGMFAPWNPKVSCPPEH